MPSVELSDQLYKLLLSQAQQQQLSLEAWLQEFATHAIGTDLYLLQQFYRRSSDLFIIVDTSLKVIKANPVFHQLLGYSLEELNRIPTLSLIHPEDRESMISAIAAMHSGIRTDGLELRCLAKDGTAHWIHWTAHLDLEQQVIYAVGHNTTRQKLAEQENERQRHFTQKIVDNSPYFVYIYDLDRHEVVYRTRGAQHIVLFDEPHDVDISLESLLAVVHPDDREKLLHNIEQWQRKPATDNLVSEYRVKTKQGTWRWLRHQNVVFSRKPDGTPLQILGTAIDVTNQKLAAVALQESEVRYRHVVEYQTDLICRYSPDFVLTFVNDAYARLFAIPGQGLVGQRIADLMPQESWEVGQQFISALTPEQPITTHQHRAVLADGSERWIEWTDRAFYDEQGHLIQYQAVGRDVTERRQVEDALQFAAQLGWMLESTRFYEALAKYLWRVLGAKYVYIGKLINPQTIETLIFLDQGEICPNARYVMDGTPCATVVGQKPRYYAENIRQLFPQDEMLQTMNAESYIAVPMWDSSGQALGLISFINDQPLKNPQLAESLLQIFAVRTAQEIERHNALEAIHQSEQRFRTVLDNAPAGIAMINQAGEIVLVNRALEQMFGYSQEELQGQPIEILVPQAERASHAQLRDDSFHTPHNRVMGKGLDLYTQRKDGEFFPVEVNLSYITMPEGMMAVAFVRDLSERQQMERAKRASQNLQQQLVKERELREMKSRFVSMVSHEFRTPMTVIMTSTALLRKHAGNLSVEQVNTRLDRIDMQILRLNQMIEDVTVLNKFERVQTTLRRTPLHLCSFLEQLAEEVSQAYENAIPIRVETSGNCHPEWFDEALLHQIFVNLLTNAVKYSLSGGKVMIHCDCDHEATTVSIQDQGIGIPAEDHKHIFTPFHRATNVGTISGTGLGLAIVKQAVEAHGGSITFESNPGQGTTFSVRLPVTEPSSQ